MSALIAVFREMAKLHAAGDQLKLRTLREQLSAAIAQTVKRVTLFPVGPCLQGNKVDRYMVIDLYNGKTYEVDDSESPDDQSGIGD
jgi:hypothetical protein